MAKTGPDKTRRWLAKQPPGTQAEVARRLGVQRGNFNNMISGRYNPGIDVVFQIEDITGGAVPARSWSSAKKLKALVTG